MKRIILPFSCCLSL